MKKALIFIIIFAVTLFLMFSFNVMWRSPSFYKVQHNVKPEEPIMDMHAYNTISETHRRPYTYSVKSKSGGKVHVLGVEHVNSLNHPQFDTIRTLWNNSNPDIALVEGRLGFLFAWIQDPIRIYGEGGLVSQLAKKNHVRLFTWEPSREDEIEILMDEFSVDKIAMFYAFRPYFSNMRYGKPENPEKKLQEYLKSRTDYNHIRGIFKSWEELDSKWQNDFPQIDWRDYSNENGWPDGYLYDIWNGSNLARDEHLIQIIIESTNKGEKVFVTMGSGHAPRIERTLRKALE